MMLILRTETETDRDAYKRCINKLYEERKTLKIYVLEGKRTLLQNAYQNIIIRVFACQYGDTEKRVKKEFFKKTCNSDIFSIEKKDKRGNIIKGLRSSADLTVSEMSTAIERFKNWSVIEAGIYLPENKEDHLIYAEKIIEQNKNYI